MNFASILDLVHNLALLLSTAFVFDLATTGRTNEKTVSRRIVIGIPLGIMGITAMLVPWTVAPGIIIDTRSILLGVSGLFFGWLPAAVAMAMTGLFRLYQGGAGAWTGTAVILASGCIGIAWRHVYKRPLSDISWKELFVFGVVLHLVMLGLMLTLPWGTALWVLSKITLPVILINPLGTLFLGMLMVNRLQKEKLQQDARHSQEHLEELVKQRTLGLEEKNTRLIREMEKRKLAEKAAKESEERYRILVDLCPGIIYRIRENGAIDFISHAVRQLGYTPEELVNTPFIDIVHPDDRKLCGRLLLEKRTGERRLQNLDVRLIHKARGPRDYALNFSFVQVSARGYWDEFSSGLTSFFSGFKPSGGERARQSKAGSPRPSTAGARAAARPWHCLRLRRLRLGSGHAI